MFAAMMAPSRAGDPEVKQLFVRIERGSSRAQAMLLTTMAQESDVRALLPTISVPTILVHLRDNAVVPVQHGRYLAEHIPEATYVELDGTDHFYFLQANDEVMDELEAFVTGQRPRPHADRTFAAVLFTDIVGSTEHVGRIGDQRWRTRLDVHDRITAEVVARRGGTVVKQTGDGVLAIFDAPSHALRAGLDLVTRLSLDGIAVRVGVHAGEIERRGDDVSGIAVHVAARVMASAAAGDVMVSSSVPPLVVGSGIEFVDRGEHKLKGVPGTWQLFVVTH
jgi:class 3 adenylate cyclase